MTGKSLLLLDYVVMLSDITHRTLKALQEALR